MYLKTVLLSFGTQWGFISNSHIFQGWEFAHLISKQITRFLSKNERMSDSLKKICSFLVSKTSNALTSLISSE